MSEKNENKSKYEQLLDELSSSRSQLVEMMDEVRKCKDAIIGTATNTNDYRSRYAKEDRIKTISSFYSTELQIRQEYNRNIISEIELRRKLEKGDDKETDIDIIKIAKQLEDFKKSANKKQESIHQIVKKIENNES